MQPHCLDAALEYAAQGNPVIPLHRGMKTPRVRRWPDTATTDAAQIRSWWVAWPGANVAIVTGDRAGYKLVVLDVDAKNDGQIPNWAPPTLMARTPSGGFHLYYVVPQDAPVRNAVNLGGPEAPGLDVRSDRGYVVAPPSRVVGDHAGDYEWLTDGRPMPIDWKLLVPAHLRDPWAGGVRREFEWRDEVPVGERNNYLTSLAGHLFATGHPAEDVLSCLEGEATQLGFTPRSGEIAQIVRSVARYH